VRLENAELGVVSRRGQDGAGVGVHVLRAADGTNLGQGHARERITSEAGCAIAEALHEDHAKLRFPMKQIWGELASL
jgi:hypothetical protein